jgi:hypothetical protein
MFNTLSKWKMNQKLQHKSYNHSCHLRSCKNETTMASRSRSCQARLPVRTSSSSRRRWQMAGREKFDAPRTYFVCLWLDIIKIFRLSSTFANQVSCCRPQWVWLSLSALTTRETELNWHVCFIQFNWQWQLRLFSHFWLTRSLLNTFKFVNSQKKRVKRIPL